MNMNIHHVSRWDIRSKTLKSDNGDKWETRDFIIYGRDGEKLFSITMFMDEIESNVVAFGEVS